MPDPSVSPNEGDAAIGGEQLAAVVMLARCIDLADVEALYQTGRHFDTVTSILDPTRWMREHKAMEASMAVARAFVAFRKAIDESAA